MAHINLLPWREARREQRKREFFGQLGMAFVVGLLVVIVWAAVMGRRIDNQQARNDYLTGQIHQLDAKIAKIKDLQKVRSQLLTRKKIIEQLQSSRSQMVHLFDALIKTVPHSVRLTSLKQNQNHLELAGVAQSNASVADYMRSLAASPWLGSPDLEKTVNRHDGSRTPYTFGLGLTLNKPADAKRAAAKQAKAEKADNTDASDKSVTVKSAADGKAPAQATSAMVVTAAGSVVDASATDKPVVGASDASAKAAAHAAPDTAGRAQS